MAETTPKTNSFTTGAWKMHLLIAAIGLAIIGIVGYGFYSGDRINTVDAAMVRSSMKMKLECSTTNLVIEGLLGEGMASSFESVWAPMDTAMQDFQSVVDESKKRRVFLPFRSAALIPADIDHLKGNLSAFKEKAAERFANKRISLFDDEADRVYRQSFGDLFGHLEELEERLRRVMSRNLTLFRYSQAAMIALCVLLTIMAANLFQRFTRQRASYYETVAAANQRLENEIAERRRSEEAVQVSEERFRQLAENIMELFWLEEIAEKNKLIYISPILTQWSEFHPSELYEDSHIFWRIVHPQDREGVINSYRKFTDGTCDFDSEFRIIRPDGTLRWIHARGFPILDAHGKMHRVAGLARDITERKRQEERREQVVRELKDFSNAVSHDLRAPLINLKGFSREIETALEIIRPVITASLEAGGQNSKEEVRTAFYEDLPEAVDFLNASISKMDRLVHSILSLSRLERRELITERLDLNAIVRDTLKSLGHQIKTRGIRVSVGDLPETNADRVSMEQIFSNLVSNAINYLDPGRAGEVEIGGERRQDETVFFVHDNGRGIKTSDTSRVFNIFERLNVDFVTGEGMGLAYVRALVRRHGGDIVCESTYGVGSTFTFSVSKRIF